MRWLEFISKLNTPGRITKFTINSPATDQDLEELQLRFGLLALPDEFLSLLQETNGINELMNGEKISELVWPIEKVIEMNSDYRDNDQFSNLYMSFDQLLFFSDAGNGDLFAFVTLAGKFDRNDIFVWNHENDSRTWVAPNLKTFIEWWTKGMIKL